MKYKNLILGIALVVGLFSGAFYVTSHPFIAGANPSKPVTTSSCATSAASSSPVYLQTGTATSTITCNVAAFGGGIELLDSATLFIQYTPSSTPGSLLGYWVEYSNDGVDYYGAADITAINATSTTVTVFPVQNFIHPYASTTLAYNAVTPRLNTSLALPTPTNYVRVVFYRPPGSLNGSVWGQIIGKYQLVR